MYQMPSEPDKCIYYYYYTRWTRKKKIIVADIYIIYHLTCLIAALWISERKKEIKINILNDQNRRVSAYGCWIIIKKE